MPTRFVHGDADQLFPVEWGAERPSVPPDAELLVLEDFGHWATQELPDEVRRLIREVP